MSSKIEELQADVQEIHRLINECQRPKVKDLLSIEVRKLETELIKLREESTSESASTAKSATPAPQGCYDVKITHYAWDQSDKFVKIFVTLKSVQTVGEESISCKFDDSEVSAKVRGLNNKNYVLNLKGLFNKTDAAKSYFKLKTDMLVIYIAKLNPGKHWPHLLASDQKKIDPTPPPTDPDNPTDGLMNLMKKMYEDGDDDLKRTIAKAWTESREKGLSSL